MNSSGSHKKPWVLTQESFDRLLAWLSPEREAAGRIYEQIRSDLIQGFRRHNCTTPEDLADETINRVAKKLPELESTYVGLPSRYFFGVAHYVHYEHLRKEAVTVPLSADPPGVSISQQGLRGEVEPEYACLQACIEKLTLRNREIILQYYKEEKQIKIRLRKELAERLGITLPLLRLQAQRIRGGLKKCILHCLTEQAAI